MGKGVEESGCGLILSTAEIFAWRDRRKPQQITVSWPRCEPDIS
jgi:hypothetical protein